MQNQNGATFYRPYPETMVVPKKAMYILVLIAFAAFGFACLIFGYSAGRFGATTHDGTTQVANSNSHIPTSADLVKLDQAAHTNKGECTLAWNNSKNEYEVTCSPAQ